MEKYDVIIIGGACAGLTAGLYSARRALSTLIITREIGGQAGITTDIENYPGTGIISGAELMKKFQEQAESFGAEIKLGEVMKIEKTENGFSLQSSAGEFESRAIILSTGLTHRKLEVPREDELAGRGITYCATCDGPLFRGKVVAVAGGGNSAFDAADYLSDICEKVYLLVRTDQYRAEQILIDSVKKKQNVEIMNFTEVGELIGEKKLEKIKVINNQTKEEREIALNGLFIEIGYRTQTDLIKGLVDLDERGYVIVDNENKTSLTGFFAAGDITNTPFKQVVISAGEGAKAALSASRFVKNVNGISDKPDWK
ncbi:thioredoxin-disulfide reductase [Patescibacteria group bacterium]|nr:thioredoxin-disulfide reductase [Patescibacteria group bacterium]